ncbi:MAG: dihydrolipoyl dehydrogenase [Bacteroidetes bacterium CG12_big_fil_rev_8_21_14_0_65_60_17]|nr:MAG: dihydrolipoyl dehydrogenase [Bacteroidetes bacterium CG12_big_fil_rev_8_21_14_0_65_60_17]
MAASSYDVVVIGSGPGGYETAIRSSQLGLKTAIVEKNKLGGVCLNIGCIPTKALLKSAEIMETMKHAADYGLTGGDSVTADFGKVIDRSRAVADKMNKGVGFLMKKNKIDVYMGAAKLSAKDTVEVAPSEDMDGKKQGKKATLKAKNIIIATGARPRELPSLPIDEKNIVSSTGAMLQKERPNRLVVVGAGAIGVEFAYFYHNMGTDVTIVELLDRIVPVEDKDVSRELAKAFKKSGIKIMTNASVEKVNTSGKVLKATIKTKTGEEVIECDQVLSAVGVVGNIESLGLEAIGVETNKGSVKVDGYGQTNVQGIYAIGDVAGPPWLAHKASHEGIICIEHIAGEDVHALDKSNIPGCTYCQPQIASVGLTEEKAKEEGYDLKVGKFPFTASGKAAAAGHPQGFVKVIFDAKYGEFLGCHIIGYDATELIAEAVVARTLETTAHEIMDSIHPHPTLSEAIMEATKVAYDIPMNI